MLKNLSDSCFIADKNLPHCNQLSGKPKKKTKISCSLSRPSLLTGGGLPSVKGLVVRGKPLKKPSLDDIHVCTVLDKRKVVTYSSQGRGLLSK